MDKQVKRSQHKESFLAGIIRENPLFVAVLGTCPALAITKTVEAAFGMGLLFTFVLVCSNVIISALRKLIPEEIETPAYIVVIAAFVTITKMLTQAYIPALYSTLGVFLSLLVVNCIVLGRAEAFANKNTVLDSLLDGIGNGIGYTLAICVIAIFREVLGAGTLTIGAIFTFIPKSTLYILKDAAGTYDYSMSLFSNPAGGFIVFGVVLAIIYAVRNRKQSVAKANARAAAFAEAAKKQQAAVAPKEAVAATPVKEAK